MKLIPIFMLVLIGGVCAKGFSQKQQLNLKLHQCNVSTLFKEIRKQTGLKFVYNEAYMKDLGKLDVNCSNRCVKDVLDEVFAPAGLECHFEHDVIFITRRTVGRLTDKAIRNKVVKGKVFDTNGETLPGATVILQGTSSGTVTDKDGNFQLPVPAGAVLKISCIGKKPKLVKITDPDRFYTVTLENDQVEMDEVVVTGYQVINPHEHVGVTTKVKAEDLEIGNATKSIEQMLEGKVAGMHIANPSGVIGQKQRVKVRGTSSILGNQEPVWVVDGIIQEDPLPFKTADFNAIADGMNEGTDLVKDFVGNAISWLSPNDIQDITVLKDVAATVLYGVKAANGVIVIQTKRGKEGRTTISYNGGVTMNFKPRYSDLYMMDSEERVDVSLELINSGRVTRTVVNPFGVEYFYQQYLKKEISYEEYRAKVEEMRHQNTDWFNVLLRDPVSQTHSLNISGGSSMINYYTSLNYNSNKGQSRQNSSEGYSANLNLNGWIFKNKLRFNAAMRGNITHTKGLNGQDPFSYAKRITRTLPAFTEDGKPYFYLDRGFRYNQDFENSQRANLNSQYALNGTLGLEWTILKGLRMNATAGFNFSHVTGRAFSSELSNYISRMCGYEFGTRIMSDLEYKISELPHGGDLKTVNSRNANWTARGQMDYVKTFNGRHRFSLTLGSEFRSSKREGYDRQTYGYMHDKGRTITAPPILILDGNTEEQKANPLYKRMTEKITEQLTNMVSFYGNVSYAYNEKYIFTASIRSDASNRFGQSKKEKFLPVYSFGLRWNMANEAWMQGIKEVLNNVSLRGSFGYQGNVAENYGSELIVRYGESISSQFGELPLYITRIPFDDLSWEKTASYNFGMDLGLFTNRMQASFNYYRKKTTDAIVMTDIAYEWGMNSMPVNDGTLTNSGWDLTVSLTPVRTKNFSWNLSFNTSKNYNDIKSRTEKKKDWREATSGNLVKTGYAYSTVWGFIYNGVNPQIGTPEISIVNEETMDYDPADATTWLKELGKLEPDFIGGLSTTLRYKTLSLSASFTLNIGAGRWLANYSTSGVPNEFDNLRKEMVYRWRKPGDEKLPGIRPGLPYQEGTDIMRKYLPQVGKTANVVNLYTLYNRSDSRFVNADFFKCNSISLRYSVPSRLLKSTGIQSLGAGISLANPFKIVSHDFKGVDPEVATGGMPLPKTVTATFSIGF